MLKVLAVAILLASAGQGDKGFNDAALAGLDAAKKHGRLTVTIRPVPRADDYGTTIDQLVAGGPDLVIGVGFLYMEPFRAASARHPQTHFLLLDVELAGLPNVRSVTFRADEGSFLAGVAAAAESKRGAVGFVGGMNMPIIQAFECGYETGVYWAAKELHRTVRGSAVYIGTTPEAFSSPAEGAEQTRVLIAQKGIDVVFAAAGASGLGVIGAAREAKLKAIGVDADQRHVAPETVITSMRKRLDRVVETAVADVRKKAFRGGVTVMTLANGGVDLVLPGQLAPKTRTLVEKARAAIVSGREPACVKERPPAPTWTPRPSAP
jgi:basic membrane protein A